MKLTVIGRDENEANIVLSSNYVSGYHAEIIQLDNGDIYLVDRSTNGTFVNGSKIAPGKETLIRRGDNVRFADVPLDWSRIYDITVPDNVKTIISIGSHYMNDVKIDGQYVSRFHATIRQLTNGKWQICDHSKNGTTVNGRMIAKEQYVPLACGDEILCAGTPVKNPAVKQSSWAKIVGIVCAAVVLFAAVGFGIYEIIHKDRLMTAQQICQKYDSSIALMICGYHFEVECGALDISELYDPDYRVGNKFTRRLMSKFIVTDKNRIEKWDGNNSKMYTGTGFFIGSEGHIATNRHIAVPWETEMTNFASNLTVIAAAEDHFKQKLTKLYELGVTGALKYISQVKVTGVLDYAMIIPNGDYLDSNNAINCHVHYVAEDSKIDLAIFSLRKSSFPSEATYIPLDKIKKNEPVKGSPILTIGFPFGVYLLDGKTKIQTNFSEGSISRNDNQYTFGMTCPSFHGASGSPVFDMYGNLIGILNAGNESVQGFNTSVRVEYLEDIIVKAGLVDKR